MNNRVLVIHEYGARNHYRALVDGLGLQVIWIEFSPMKLIAKSLLKRDLSLFKKQFINIFHLLTLYYFVRADRIILGIAPFDWRILLFVRLLRNKHVVYHSSWPYWDGERYPKRFMSKLMIPVWRNCLRCCAGYACVTSQVRISLIKFIGEEKSCAAEVVAHAISDEHFLPSVPTQKGREFDFCYVGRIEVSKGILKILELAKELPEMSFLLIGDVRTNLRLCDYKNITYLPYVKNISELADYYRSSRYFICASLKTSKWEELFGLSLLESMAAGCIPLTTSCVGPRHVLQNFTYAKFFSEEGYVSGVLKVVSELERDPLMMERLSNELVEMSRKYTSDEISKRWVHLLESHV